jgi:hypothetical protein
MMMMMMMMTTMIMMMMKPMVGAGHNGPRQAGPMWFTTRPQSKIEEVKEERKRSRRRRRRRRLLRLAMAVNRARFLTRELCSTVSRVWRDGLARDEEAAN